MKKIILFTVVIILVTILGAVYFVKIKNTDDGIMPVVKQPQINGQRNVLNINDISVNDKYIHPLKWPPVVKIVDEPFVCKGDLLNDYCVVKINEGAAGSTYTQYSYTKKYGTKTAKIDFTIQAVQCMNYDEPNRSECLQKQAGYDLTGIVNILFSNFR